jgi:hypothetical protein
MLAFLKRNFVRLAFLAAISGVIVGGGIASQGMSLPFVPTPTPTPSGQALTQS